MTDEELIKNQFPNDEFLQSGVLQIVDKCTAELEKENAELKHTIAILRQEKDNASMHAKAMEVVAKTRSDQLTKAKEIIKAYYEDNFDEAEFYSLQRKAEQFLKDNEVEK